MSDDSETPRENLREFRLANPLVSIWCKSVTRKSESWTYTDIIHYQVGIHTRVEGQDSMAVKKSKCRELTSWLFRAKDSVLNNNRLYFEGMDQEGWKLDEDPRHSGRHLLQKDVTRWSKSLKEGDLEPIGSHEGEEGEQDAEVKQEPGTDDEEGEQEDEAEQIPVTDEGRSTKLADPVFLREEVICSNR